MKKSTGQIDAEISRKVKLLNLTKRQEELVFAFLNLIRNMNNNGIYCHDLNIITMNVSTEVAIKLKETIGSAFNFSADNKSFIGLGFEFQIKDRSN